MIVVTGPGRSGTSLLAQVYKGAGADPGGQWLDSVSAGWEDRAIVVMNETLSAGLGASMMSVRPYTSPAPRLTGPVKGLLSPQRRRSLMKRYNALPWNRVSGFPAVDWSKVPGLAATHGEALRELSTSRTLCKDPQFCSTLPVWLTASADIEHVVVMTRNIDDVVRSRSAAGHFNFRDTGQAKNTMIYSVGNLLTTLADHGVPHTILRFPDFLADTDAVADRLPTPGGVTADDLRRAFRETADASLVSKAPS